MTPMETTAFIGDDEATVEFEAFYQTAKTSGPPEDCYPEDEELNVIKVIYHDREIDFDSLEDKTKEHIEQRCWDAYYEAQSIHEEAEWYAELNRGYAQDRI